MSELQSCLPENARLFFIRLRNLKHEAARTTYHSKLQQLRADAAARNVLRSGHQELAEWNLSQEFIGDLAYGHFEAAIEACTLYELTIDKRLSDCIENAVKEFLTAQRKNAIQLSAQNVPGAVKIPLSVRQQLADGRNLPRFNEILIDLEKARVESLRTAASRNKATQQPTESLEVNRKHRAQNRPDVMNVLISSPSDVQKEREAVTAAIYAWNASHNEATRVLLNPIMWESSAYPESGGRPQGLLNRQIVERGDFLIGIFGTRLGTPTGEAESGTIEEIDIFREAGKYVALYFSEADVPRDADRLQLDALAAYKRERQKDTLYGVFKSESELQQRVSHDLTNIVTNVGRSLQLGMWATGASVTPGRG